MTTSQYPAQLSTRLPQLTQGQRDPAIGREQLRVVNRAGIAFIERQRPVSQVCHES